MSGFAVRIDVIKVSTHRPTMFVLPGPVTLLALILFIEQVALEILHGITTIFEVKAAGQLVTFIIEFMIEAYVSLEICFVEIVIVATIIIAVGKRFIIDDTFFGIIQVSFAGTSTVATFQIYIEGCVR